MLVCLTIVGLTGCRRTPVGVDQNAGFDKFSGKWTGKWDGQWKVVLTVTRSLESNDPIVIYEWEELPGGSLNQAVLGAFLEDDKLTTHLFVIKLSASNPEHASAVGYFESLRKADLVRVDKTPQEKVDLR